MIGNISTLYDLSFLRIHALQSVSGIIVVITQIFVVLKSAGFLNHVAAIFLHILDTRGIVKLLQILCQLPDLCGGFRPCVFHHRAQFFYFIGTQLLNRLAQLIQLLQAL